MMSSEYDAMSSVERSIQTSQTSKKACYSYNTTLI